MKNHFCLSMALVLFITYAQARENSTIPQNKKTALSIEINHVELPKEKSVELRQFKIISDDKSLNNPSQEKFFAEFVELVCMNVTYSCGIVYYTCDNSMQDLLNNIMLWDQIICS